MSKAESVPNVILPLQPRGLEWWRDLAQEQGHNTFLVAFSRGKDSIATACALKKAGFDLVPFAMIGVPGLSFVEETFAYYEKNLFGGRRIVRVMYHHFARILGEGAYQLPDNLPVCAALRLDPDMVTVQKSVAEKAGIPVDTWTGIGVRATDNLLRRKIIAVNGPTASKKRQFFTIWDWNLADLIGAISGAGLQLPPDYKMWGHSWFELMPEFLASLREHYPDDLRKVLEWFPLAEAELYRWDNMRN